MTKKITEKNSIYRTLFESLGVATVIADEDGTIYCTNRQFLELSGYRQSELEEKKKWSELIVNGDLTRMRQYQEFIDHKAAGPAQSHEFKLAAGNGSIKDVHIFRSPLAGTDRVAVSFVDITDLVKTGKQVSSSEEKYRSLIESTDDSIYMTDRDGTYLFVNRQMLARLCVSEANIIGKRYGDFHDAQDTAEFAGYIEKVFETAMSHRYEHKSGKGNDQRYMLRTLSPIVDGHTGRVKFVAVVSKEITDIKKTEEKLKYLSLHDPLTNLYNRAYFEEEMHRLDNNRFELVGLIMCDIDGLKLINDTLGHDKGDELLAVASRVIRKSFRESDVVARVGGDEFAILLPNSPKSKVEEICNRIRSSVIDYNRENPRLPLGISTGFAIRTGPGQSMAALYREADNSMYKEKLFGSRHARNVIVRNLLNTIETKGITTRRSVKRLRQLVTILGSAAGLSDKRLKDLTLLAQFHDIGNVSIHDRILLKEGSLNAEELSEMRKHCDIGHRIAQSAANLTHIADYILKHHEWWNGSGYPLGLAGEEIPFESRIMAIADAYESMTGGRPHRKAVSREEALKELRKCAGSQFDPDLVEKFIEIVAQT
ncbi:MAG: diguanylate cyclase [Syntrophorhabdaceae bacterium]|nr:diguanylate cyclase [Syntrophorhabdaceae bacterium]